MAKTDTPLVAIKQCIERSATGLLEITSESMQARVCFQRGRLVWAKCSGLDRRLIDYLTQFCPLDVPTLDELVKECLAAKRPFAQEIVAQDYATLEQVQAALRAQLKDTLTEIVCNPDACEFRFTAVTGASTYDERLTFDLRDFAPLLLTRLAQGRE